MPTSSPQGVGVMRDANKDIETLVSTMKYFGWEFDPLSKKKYKFTNKSTGEKRVFVSTCEIGKFIDSELIPKRNLNLDVMPPAKVRVEQVWKRWRSATSKDKFDAIVDDMLKRMTEKLTDEKKGIETELKVILESIERGNDVSGNTWLWTYINHLAKSLADYGSYYAARVEMEHKIDEVRKGY